ncbi:MAG: hypothetical protein HQL18_02035 [Candidatus Omnitrophica bacterium]|nr:hypothetical protein [Candidatus Omnitrophota bacterium]
MKIMCPACNQEVAAEDINLSQEIAKCANCNNVFSFADKVSGASQAQDRPQIEKPKQYELINDADGFAIVRRWLGCSVVPLLFFCVFWNGFMAVWFTVAFTHKQYAMAAFGSIHAAVGLGMLYGVLAMFLNKTTIRITYDSVTVRHAPLPWMGQKTISRAEVKQFYSQEDISQTKNGTSRSYAVRLLTSNEKVVDLVTGLAGRDEALFIEQQVEKFLGIRDENVSGELSR